MDFDQATQLINDRLKIVQPKKFYPSWVYKQAPKAYRYIWLNVRTNLGDIDWDKVTSKLDREFQERWTQKQERTVKYSWKISKVN